MPTGAIVPAWYVFEFPDWVNVIALTKDDKFVFISQYRHGLGETRYELVAGCREEGETAEESARLWRRSLGAVYGNIGKSL